MTPNGHLSIETTLTPTEAQLSFGLLWAPEQTVLFQAERPAEGSPGESRGKLSRPTAPAVVSHTLTPFFS